VVPSDPDSSLVGKVLDERYEMLELIGDGGVGVVYRARRLRLERMVAIKVLQESLVQDTGFVRRFQREAVAMSRLYHPHCLAVTDFGVYESRPYLVLEWVPGQTVTKLLENGPFLPQRAVGITLQLLETLEYFHRHHVIHRDLKSENVMLVESGGTTDFVKVLDFGMAKILEGPGADSQLSKIGLVPGTPSAMAPEQIYQLPPDPRIDIYATGILLYEMVVGHRPFSGPDMAAIVKMQVTTPPKPPREILGEDALSAELEQVIIKALQKDRFDRFGTAEDMAAALRLTPEGQASASPHLTVPPVLVAPRRRWALRAGLGGMIAAGILVAAVVWPKNWRQREAPVAMAAPDAGPPLAPPPPAPVVEPWLAHRDLAVTYTSRGQHDDAFREVKASVGDNAAAAGADPALVDAAVAALSADRVVFVVDTFRSNPRLVDALAQVTSSGTTAELRHAAYDALRALGQESSADLVAMRMLDFEQASACPPMRVAFKKLRASKDPRFKKFMDDLRARGRKDRHVRCLGRLLARR
jgi:hypothetical protein